MKVDHMNSFGGDAAFTEINWESITDIKQLPPAMQIKDSDVNPEASIANFVCYADKHKIDNKYVSGLTGLSSLEIKQLVEEAHSADLYTSLANEFLRG